MPRGFSLLLSLLCQVVGGWAFHSSTQVPSVTMRLSFLPVSLSSSRPLRSLAIHFAAKKGFGNVPEPPPAKKARPSSSSEAAPVAPTPSAAANQDPDVASPSSLNAGQRALEQMRRERAEQRDAELRRVRELLDTDKQVQEAPAAIPERVAQRMGQRMLPFVGLPLLGSMATFVAFWYLATYKNMEFQPSLVATATVFFLVVGLLVRLWTLVSRVVTQREFLRH